MITKKLIFLLSILIGLIPLQAADIDQVQPTTPPAFILKYEETEGFSVLIGDDVLVEFGAYCGEYGARHAGKIQKLREDLHHAAKLPEAPMSASSEAEGLLPKCRIFYLEKHIQEMDDLAVFIASLPRLLDQTLRIIRDKQGLFNEVPSTYYPFGQRGRGEKFAVLSLNDYVLKQWLAGKEGYEEYEDTLKRALNLFPKFLCDETYVRVRRADYNTGRASYKLNKHLPLIEATLAAGQQQEHDRFQVALRTVMAALTQTGTFNDGQVGALTSMVGLLFEPQQQQLSPQRIVSVIEGALIMRNQLDKEKNELAEQDANIARLFMKIVTEYRKQRQEELKSAATAS